MPTAVVIRLAPRDAATRSAFELARAIAATMSHCRLASVAIVGALRSGESITARLTSVEETVDDQWATELTEGTTLRLADSQWRIEARASDANEHPLAGVARWETLLDALTRPPDRVPGLAFLTPCVFTDRDPPVPLPALVYGGLVARWNAVAPTLLPDEVTRYATECLILRDFTLSSRRHGQRTGFVGRTRYAIRRRDPIWLGPIAALTALAFFTGVGEQTMDGFGCVQLA